MKLKIGQVWISDLNPHESFRIYDGIIDTCVDAFSDETLPFDEQPESTKVFFWERIDLDSFLKFVNLKKGKGFDSTYPYANCGESKKGAIINKIKKNHMKLKDK